jgi:hypothetical protein
MQIAMRHTATAEGRCDEAADRGVAGIERVDHLPVTGDRLD